jgi:hypothetical protein
MQVVVTHCPSLDSLFLTERGLQVRSSNHGSGGDGQTGDRARADDVPGGNGSHREGGEAEVLDLVVELAGEWTVGISPEEWTALAASLAAQHNHQIVLLR